MVASIRHISIGTAIGGNTVNAHICQRGCQDLVLWLFYVVVLIVVLVADVVGMVPQTQY